MDGSGIVVRQVCEKYLRKGQVFWTFMDLEKAFDRVDREALWRVLQIYGIGGRLMRAVKSFYEGSRTCVRAGRVRVIGSECWVTTGLCAVTVTVQRVHGWGCEGSECKSGGRRRGNAR